MILRDELEDDVNRIVYWREYPPYWLDPVNKIKNPDVTDDTFFIMDLKAKKQKQINQTVSFLDENSEGGIVVAVVPSHDPATRDSGIRRVAQQLALLERIDGTSCLLRHTQAPKKSGGGSRDKAIDLRTIRVVNPEIIKGRLVLLLDDVTSTGGSLEACKRLLQNAGAKNVQCLAIGKTVHKCPFPQLMP
jgi:predicted amidophosphoribosyltransferase